MEVKNHLSKEIQKLEDKLASLDDDLSGQTLRGKLPHLRPGLEKQRQDLANQIEHQRQLLHEVEVPKLSDMGEAVEEISFENSPERPNLDF